MGRALVVGLASGRASSVDTLQRLYGFECGEADDPYSAMLELCRRKTVYNAVIFSLASLYREELGVVGTINRRFPHIEIWLTQTDGRQAALAECMRLGADGLLGEDGLHRTGPVQPAPAEAAPLRYAPPQQPEAAVPESPSAQEAASLIESIGEPVLTAEELRALLSDQPAMPAAGSAESTGGSGMEQR